MPSPPSPRAHRRIASEPGWRPEGRYTAGDLPPETRGWLLDDGSLTARLQALGTFRVQRRHQGWHFPLPSERVLLECEGRELALVREVSLWLDERPVVFARSVFPAASLTGGLAHLRRLRNSSLGAILFSEPGMRRSPFEVARLPGDSPYLPTELQQAGPAWGRRSRFQVRGRALMVSEVFLENFRPWPALLPVHRSRRGKVG